MAWESLNTSTEYPSLINEYGLEKAEQHRAFIRDEDKTWYEVDFPRVVQDTKKIMAESFTDDLVIRSREDIFTAKEEHDWDEIMASSKHAINALFSNLHQFELYFPEKIDLQVLISYYTEIAVSTQQEIAEGEISSGIITQRIAEIALSGNTEMDEKVESMKENIYKLEAIAEKRKTFLDRVKKVTESYTNNYVIVYHALPEILPGPFVKEEMMAAEKKISEILTKIEEKTDIIEASRVPRMMTLNDALNQGLVKPISEKRYQYYLHNWHHWDLCQQMFDENEGELKLKNAKCHLEDWRKAAVGMRKWAEIFETMATKFPEELLCSE